jgi:septal ring factor EnvC (AmiA/AmiB activator)
MLRSLLFLGCCGLANLAVADTSSERLEDVKTEIKQLETTLSANKANKKALYQQLKQQSRDISAANNKLVKLKQQLKQNEQELATLKARLSKEEQNQQQETDALLAQLRSAYIHAQPNYLKVLLNQNNPAQLARTNTYFQYFHQARQQQLKAIEQQLSNLTEQQKQLFSVQKQHFALLERQQRQQKNLKAQQKQRKTTLASLDKLINSQGSKLNALHEEEQALQALLTKISQEPLATPANSNNKAPVTKVNFNNQKGRLTWPVKGKLLARYGSKRNLGKLTWKGIMIDAKVGKEVVASAAGKVVFADWMRGFGLLVIIDHGQKYMTLYGNNDALLKQVGEFVAAGDVIAQSGSEGMHEYTGLYFEVRYKGNPTNPLKWLGKKG